MRKAIFTAVVLFGLCGGVYAETPVEQLEMASGYSGADMVLAPAVSDPAQTPQALKSNPAWAILDDAYNNVDFSGNSDGGASRGVLVLKRDNNPSSYTMKATPAQGDPQSALPALVRTATPGSADYSNPSGLMVRLTFRPDGEDYFSPAGKLLFKRTATPSDDVFTGADGTHIFTKTTTNEETTVFTCADGSACMAIKLRPWGDEFFVEGRRILLRAACPGGDVFYGEDNTRILVRGAGPGGSSYYRAHYAPQLPDIVKILKLKGDAAVWRAVLFDHKRGRTNRRIIWPLPAPLY